ncbi:MAG: hypothetical protein KAH57_00335 [Thermoplasmata archaeon]|nr:hypothetical protein [Thermoplasmata archaeon]
MARKKNNVLAIVAIVTGILAILTFTGLMYTPLIAGFGPILATAAIICGWLGRIKRKGRTMASVGMVLGLIWWALTIIGIILHSFLGLFNGLF